MPRYLHLGLRTTEERMARARVRIVWAILRQRHPLLASYVKFHDYHDVRFVYVTLYYFRERTSLII
jgi:hypothetical protein